jgi:FkbM family methyltransferase
MGIRYDMIQLTDTLLSEKFKPTNFIEIGSRDGHDTSYVCNYWNLSPSNCYIIEAHPDCYNYITQTYPSFNVFNIAASDKTEPLKFNAGIVGIENNIGMSSVLKLNNGDFKSQEVTVGGWRLEDVMNELNIISFDFMKLDVEGFALNVLKGFGPKLKLTKYIQVELEDVEIWSSQSYYSEVVNYLQTMNFNILQDIVLDESGVQLDVLFKNNNL